MKAVDALNGYFQPKLNKTYGIYMFTNGTQSSDKSLDSYCKRMRRLAQTCKFDHDQTKILVSNSRVR